jgi:hypothetical protein
VSINNDYELLIRKEIQGNCYDVISDVTTIFTGKDEKEH